MVKARFATTLPHCLLLELAVMDSFGASLAACGYRVVDSDGAVVLDYRETLGSVGE